MNSLPGLRESICHIPCKRPTPRAVFYLSYPFYWKSLFSHMGAYDGSYHPCNRISITSKRNSCSNSIAKIRTVSDSDEASAGNREKSFHSVSEGSNNFLSLKPSSLIQHFLNLI